MKPKIILLIKVPPPTTGATLMNIRVRDSKLLSTSYDLKSFEMSYASSVKDLGKFSILKIFKVLLYSINLIYQLLTKKYSFIYFQISPHGSAFFRDILYVLIIKFFRIRILYHLRGKGIKQKTKNVIYRILYITAFKNENIIVLSDLLTFDIKDVYKGKVFIVPNGIPDINYKPKEKTRSNNPLRILFLSNLLLSKGITDFIESILILKRGEINIECYIVGDEGDLNISSLDSLLSTKDLKNVITYLGKKYGKEKELIFQNTDLLIYPTLEDIWGNVILEAMQNGIPIIATREGAIPEIIDDGINGFIVNKQRPDQIAEKVILLFNDRDLLLTMGRAGRLKYETKYMFEIFENNMKYVFDEVKNKIND